MANVRLLPRLTPLAIQRLLDDRRDETIDSKAALNLITDDATVIWFAATGGHQDWELVQRIAEAIKVIACRHGFPDEGSQMGRSLFDTEVAIYLAGIKELQTGEALRNDVWAFLTVTLLSDVVNWRFAGDSIERFAGGVRNAFQRLWMRGVTLDLGEGSVDRWKLVETLSEDAMVQIFERASIAADARLSRAMANAWVEMAARNGRSGMEAIMRRATKYLRIRKEIIDLSYLRDDELLDEARRAFDLASFHASDDEDDQDSRVLSARAI